MGWCYRCIAGLKFPKDEVYRRNPFKSGIGVYNIEIETTEQITGPDVHASFKRKSNNTR